MVHMAKSKASNGKSPGEDLLTNEMIKRGSPILKDAIKLLCQILMDAGKIPTAWKIEIYVPVYKKGDSRQTQNFRPIGKTSNLYKLFERICDGLIRNIAHIIEEQCGFRPKFGTHTLLTRMQILFGYARRTSTKLSLAYIDFQEAFERVWRAGLMFRLWEAGIRGRLWLVVDDMLTNTTAKVRTNYGDTKGFRTQWVSYRAVYSLPSCSPYSSPPYQMRSDLYPLKYWERS